MRRCRARRVVSLHGATASPSYRIPTALHVHWVKPGSDEKSVKGGFDIELARRRIFAVDMSVEKLARLMGSEDMLNDEGDVVEEYRGLRVDEVVDEVCVKTDESKVKVFGWNEAEEIARDRPATPATPKSSGPSLISK